MRKKIGIPNKTMNEWSFLQRSFFRFVVRIVSLFCHRFFNYEVNGLNYINSFPEGTPVIYCTNHRSYLDSLLLASAIFELYGKRTRVGVMASGKAMQNNPFFGLVRFIGAFPVFKEKQNAAFDYALRLLEEKTAVFITPQGKRIKSDPYHDYFHLVQEGKSGVGRIILKLNGKVIVIPSYIHGAAEAFSPSPKLGAYISLSFCKPMFWNEYTRKGGWNESDPQFFEKSREIVDKIMLSIRDQMLKQEKQYFIFLNKKIGTEIEKIDIPPRKKVQFQKFLSTLNKIHPKKLLKYNETRFDT